MGSGAWNRTTIRGFKDRSLAVGGRRSGCAAGESNSVVSVKSRVPHHLGVQRRKKARWRAPSTSIRCEVVNDQMVPPKGLEPLPQRLKDACAIPLHHDGVETLVAGFRWRALSFIFIRCGVPGSNRPVPRGASALQAGGTPLSRPPHVFFRPRNAKRPPDSASGGLCRRETRPPLLHAPLQIERLFAAGVADARRGARLIARPHRGGGLQFACREHRRERRAPRLRGARQEKTRGASVATPFAERLARASPRARPDTSSSRATLRASRARRRAARERGRRRSSKGADRHPAGTACPRP